MQSKTSLKTLLVIGFVWPEPKSSAAGTRLIQLIKLFQSQGFKVLFASAANKTPKSFNLEQIGVDSFSIDLNCSSFDDFISNLNPDAVLFDRFMTEEQFGWRVTEQCPKTIKLLDTEDFHGLRKGRGLALKTNAAFSIAHLQNETTKREIASIYRCDLSIIISEVEVELLSKEFNIDKQLLVYLPFLLEPISFEDKTTLPKYEDRQHFITIGNFLHQPNYDSILHLKQQIWPLIKAKLPKAEFHIYGAYASQKITQLHKPKDNFFIKGFANDVNEVMQYAKVCLAPLRFGAGLKGKLVDAMVNGTPCVMSTIAAEGMFGNLPSNGFIENSPEAFAKYAVTLYIQQDIWIQKQNNGFECVNKRFNSLDFETQFETRIATLFENIDAHRQQNFIGQLLNHKTLQSTKYMSKWIEEKNK